MRLIPALLCFGMIACGPFDAEGQGVRVIGRSVSDVGGFSVQWPASGFQANFGGPAFSATIKDDGGSIYEVEVDGAIRLLPLEKGEKTYTLWQGAAGDHVITVTRRTGSNSGATRFSDFKAIGRITATPAPARRLLVIGDSISTGYGVGGDDQHCSFTYSTEIATDAYPVLSARAFGADLQVAAIDGFGLVKNYDGDAFTMRLASWRTLPQDEPRISPASWQPQAIVVNLGTNDFSAGVEPAAFTAAYTAYLEDLRLAYPDATIFAVAGPMLDGAKLEGLSAAVRDAVVGRVKAGDKRLEFLRFSLARGGRVYGCDWHPGRDTQKGMALALSSAITRALGWTSAALGGAPSGRPS